MNPAKSKRFAAALGNVLGPTFRSSLRAPPLGEEAPGFYDEFKVFGALDVKRAASDAMDSRASDKQVVVATLATLVGPDAASRVRLGRFPLVRVLGRGAMGTVFEAHDPVSGGRLAVKVLHDVNGRGVSRIKHEFRALAGVVHPNLVALYELHQEEGLFFFTMELVDGVPFDRWVRAEDPTRFDERRLRRALAGLAAGVHTIHSAGKLHRDLKPANVLVRTDGTVKVLDYGLMCDKLPELAEQAESALRGTPAYMAPESAINERVSEASDWYAVGVMLFESLTGCLPFQGDLVRVLNDKQSREAPRADASCRGLPPDLVELAAQLMHREPAARPEPVALLDTLGVASSTPDVSIAPPASAFVGRTADFQRWREAQAKAHAGRPQLLLFGGPSGIGKTTLIERLCVQQREGVILAGRCHEQESVPFKIFDLVVESLSRTLQALPASVVQTILPRHLHALAQLFPVLRPLCSMRFAPSESKDPVEQRSRAFGALKELLARLSDRRPVTIVVDDLQWGDTDSVLMLKHLFARPDPPPLLFVGTYRSEEMQNEVLQELLDPRAFGSHVDVQTCAVGPLSREAGVELVHALSKAEDVAAQAERIVAEAGGIPLFIVELVRTFEEREPPTRLDGSAPRMSLADTVLPRVQALAPDARHLLNLVSIADGPLETAVAVRAAGLHGYVEPTFLELRAARLVRLRRERSGDMVEIYHDRVREVLLGRLSPEDLAALHGLLAQAISEHGTKDVEVLVSHYVGAGQHGKAGEAALAGAHAAAKKLAFNHAAKLFLRASTLLPPQYPGRWEVHVHLAHALAQAGRGAQSAEAYCVAAESAPAERVLELERSAAQQYLRSGRTREGLALATRVLSSTGVKVPQNEALATAAFLWERARLKTHGLELRRGKPSAEGSIERLVALRDLSPALSPHNLVTGALLQARYLNEALRHGDPEYALQALAWEVYNASLEGGRRREKWVPKLLEAVAAQEERMQTPSARALTNFAQSASLLFSACRFRDAAVPALRAKEIFAEQPGAFWERSVVDFFHLICLEYIGSLDEQVRRATEALRDATDRDDQFLRQLMLFCVPYAYLIRDDPEQALDFLRREETSLEAAYATTRLLWLFRMADVMTYMGNAVGGLELFVSEWSALVRSHIYRSEYVRCAAHYFRGRCALAAYAEKGDPRTLALARESLKALRTAIGAFGACGQALAVGAAMAGGRDPRSELEHACARLSTAQADLIALYVRRRLCEHRGDLAGAQRVDEELQHQGVVDPKRWLWTHMPIVVS